MTQERKADVDYGKIYGLHKGILSAIDDIQKNTSKVLLSQEKEIITYFNERIYKIRKEFQAERI